MLALRLGDVLRIEIARAAAPPAGVSAIAAAASRSKTDLRIDSLFRSLPQISGGNLNGE